MIKLAIAYSSDAELKISVEEYRNFDEIRDIFSLDVEGENVLLSGKSVDISDGGELTAILIIK